MRYLGGKSKIRKQVSNYLLSISSGQAYLEPFVGGGWILQEMAHKSISATASDMNEALITMYKALQNGWTPPDVISEETYRAYKRLQPPDDPLTAFIGFGCSFAGKWFGGYARSSDKVCYAATTKRSLLKQLPSIKKVNFLSCSYTDHTPENMLIYCDPPYAGTTSYDALPEFNHEVFWSTMRLWSKNNIVIVSEYCAPADFKCVYSSMSQMGMSTGLGNRIKREDKLFRYLP